MQKTVLNEVYDLLKKIGAYAELGKQFIKLSEQCHTQINTDARGCWKDEVRV